MPLANLALLKRYFQILRGLSFSLFLACLVLCVAGCNQDASLRSNPERKAGSEDSNSAIESTVSKIPIRIFAALPKEVLDAIARRWASASEQPIDLQPLDDQLLFVAADNLPRNANSLRVKPQADILIVESRWLATIAEQKWVRPLPTSMADVVPKVSHWERIATYGQKLWGVPLGTNFLVAVERKNATVQQSNEESKEPSTKELSKGAPIVSDSELDWIVDRFLVTAAANNPTRSDSSFLFKPTGSKSRLSEPWLAASVEKFLNRFNLKQSVSTSAIKSIAQPPESTWQNVRSGNLPNGLGWPDVATQITDSPTSTDGTSANTTDQDVRLKPPEAWTDSGRSLLILIADTNRQSAASENFIRWLSEDAQRQTLSEQTSRIKPTPDNLRKITDRPDRDKYHELISTAVEDRYVTLELQFAGATAYRRALGQALLKTIQNEMTAKDALLECHRQWEAITEKRGRENQQRLLYKSLELATWEG